MSNLKTALEALIAEHGAYEVQAALDECSPFKEEHEERMATFDAMMKRQHESSYRDVADYHEILAIKPSWISGQVIGLQRDKFSLCCRPNKRYKDQRELYIELPITQLEAITAEFEGLGFVKHAAFDDPERFEDLFNFQHEKRFARQNRPFNFERAKKRALKKYLKDNPVPDTYLVPPDFIQHLSEMGMITENGDGSYAINPIADSER